MKMSKTVCIDGFSLSINKKQRGFLQFLIENGFFREVGEDTYVSLPKNRTASLCESALYVSPSAPTSKPNENIDSPSMVAASEFLVSLLASRSAFISFNDFALLTLSRYNFPNLKFPTPKCDPIGDVGAAFGADFGAAFGGAAADCSVDFSGDCSGDVGYGLGVRGNTPRLEKPQVTYEPCVEETTEGSEFEELDRLEHTLNENPVKRKRNSPMIEAIKKLGLDEDLEKLAEDWRKYAIEKMPWLKETFTVGSFYIELMKIQKSVAVDGQQINVRGLREIFMFIRNDNFWKDQAVSPKKLLTPSRNGIRKVDNILLSINKKIRKTAPLQGVDLNTDEAPF